MNKKIVTVFVLMLVLSSITVFFNKTVSAVGTDYYVAKPANGGDDTNHNGLYPTDEGGANGPFSTIQHAIQYHATNQGDTVYVRQGNYNEIIYMQASGTAGNPITLAGYPGENVVINGAGLSIPSGYGIINLFTSGGTAKNNYLTFKNLVIENSTAERGLRCLDHPTISPSHIIIDNCSFNNIHENAIWLGNSQFGTYGRGNNITITHCSFNYIQDVTHSRECVTIYACDDVLIEYSTWKHINKTAIDVCTASDNITIDHNIINNTGIESGGAGIYLDGSQIGNTWVSNVTISNNLIYGNRQGMRFSSEVSNSGLENITIENNVLNITTYNGMFFQFDGDVPSYYNDITVKYNTIYVNGPSAHAVSLSMTASYINDFVLANNIIMSSGTTNRQLYVSGFPSTETDLHRENNLYYHTSMASNAMFSDGSYKFESSAIINDNPDFVSLATYDFHLTRTSPALNRPISNYTVLTDYEGNVRPIYNNLYDIGAYEYNGGPPIMSNPQPSNSETGVVLTPTCSINASGNHTLDVYFYGNATGPWVLYQKYTTVGNGTQIFSYTDASINNHVYYWKVAVNDGVVNISSTFYFTTMSSTSGDLVESTEVIEHNLGTTPNFISITLTSYPNSKVFYYVDAIGDTTFALHMLTEPGVTVGFTWRAEKI